MASSPPKRPLFERLGAPADSAHATRSLPEAHRSVKVWESGDPKRSRFRQWLAFAGPGFLVSVGYMDPGNWGTDLAGGSQFGYTLLWVILASNLMAIFLQVLCARLGIVTGRDLAQSCRDYYARPVGLPYGCCARLQSSRATWRK